MNSVLKLQQRSVRLPTLEIAGFRAFSRLVFRRLGEVNLIVGKNSAGKTSVLEALRLYAEGGASRTIQGILNGRDLLEFGAQRGGADLIERLDLAFEQLFHRKADGVPGDMIRIGPFSGASPVLVIKRVLTHSSADPTGEQETLLADDPGAPDAEPALRVEVGSRRAMTVPLSRFEASSRWRGWSEIAPEVSVYPDGADSGDLSDLWDKVALTELEEAVLDALRIIEPGVERLSFVSHSNGYDRIPVVKVAGSARPFPLRNLGDGMSRLLDLALSMVNAQHGFLLVDEIENGIHYSVQPDLWRLIFRTAARLNVQVFATTHSWDCIKAFQEVASSEPEIEGMVHRLERRQDGTVGVVDIAEDDLAIVARNQIEIR